ncbi:putative disease resistance protein [Citrus sinensis]|uniref:Disease resistance protein n=1 Tax=Citrus sinensis TaxID=2711 RepID=A0ACB8JAB3_CITSI|nr:putative disease resistance protein [Citrus sinensis]
MGNACSVSFSCDDTISHCLDCIVSQAGYICNLKDNLAAFIRVLVAEQRQWRRLQQVQGWLSRVQDVEKEVPRLLAEIIGKEEEILGGFCSGNSIERHKYGKRVVESLKNVQSLRKEGDFKDVAQTVPENPVDERPLPPAVVGFQSTLDRVWRCLTEEPVGIVGLHGMGGVGKTTLLTQINNSFLHTSNNFDFVIWEVVSRDLQLEKMQESIAKKIGLCNESWDSKSFLELSRESSGNIQDHEEHEVCVIIVRFISHIIVFLFHQLLDGIWELVDLARLGLPVPSRTSESKVVFTTREFELCGQMDAHKSFKVECLGYEDAWRLFEEKVGRNILDSHPDIPELAETVARECGGLPLALITVGRAMASMKAPREWEHAIDVLRSSASKFSGMEKRVLSRLKFSYDFLPSNETRFCLLYCSLFPEDYSISIEDLIDCWICEGFLDDLLHACLLEEEDDNHVKMHDVVRDMALWIASTTEKQDERYLVLAGVVLTETPRSELWQEVTRMSLMQNKIWRLPESPASPHLLTLFLSSNYISMANEEFFQSMASLRVLKLSHTFLPRHFLLRYLVNLKCLNLEYTHRISKIPGQLISNLKMLEALRMFICGSSKQKSSSVLFGDSFVLVKELLGLKHLNVLTITLRSFAALQRLLASPSLQSILSNTPSLSLTNCPSLSSLSVFTLASLRHLEALDMTSCKDLEEMEIDYAGGGVKRIRETHGFFSLRKVLIGGSKLRHVTWLILAPNLKHIEMYNCGYLEEIISLEKLGEIPSEDMQNLIPFGRLECLRLYGLDKLRSIYPRALPFPHLKELKVDLCPELKKLPFDCTSGLERKLIIKGHEWWWNNLQWDDQATQNAFLPSLKTWYF